MPMVYDTDGCFVPVFVRSAFNYDADEVSRKTAFACTDPTMTQQEFKEECDINTIVERFGLTGELPVGAKIPFNADFGDVVLDYRSALQMLDAADDAFMSFPAKIREEFRNDSRRFVDFCSDPANLPRLKEWGLARAEMPLGAAIVPAPGGTAPPPPTTPASGS